MEIVRQRKKRLLAWILTLVLCVGMWQGNVHAEGEEGGDGAITPTEAMPTEVPPTEAEPTDGGDESEDPVIASETRDGDVQIQTAVLSYMDNLEEIQTIRFSGDSIQVSEDTISLPANENSFTVQAYTGEHEHYLISWSVSGSGIEGKENEGEDNPVKTADNQTWRQYHTVANVGYGSIELQFGRILLVNVIADGSTGETQKFVQTSVDDIQCEVQLPIKNTEIINENGKFFSQWGTTSEDGIVVPFEGDKLFIEYGDNLFEEREISICSIYESLQVPNTGRYALPNKFTYTLGNNGELWDIGDGYTYSGGISFVGPEVEYTYTKK